MNTQSLIAGIFLLAALTGGCSTLPERPGSDEQGSGAYAQSRNQACLIDAQRALDFGNNAEAERSLSRWQGPMEDPRPLTLLGQVAFAKRQFVLSAELYARALTFAPDSVAVLYRTAQVQEVAGHWESAARNYERTVQLQRDHAEAATGLLRSCTALEDGQRGLRIAQELAPQFAENAEFLALAADLAFFEGDFDSCITWTQTVQDLDGLHFGGEERLVLALAWTGRNEAAIAAAGRSNDREWAPIVYRTVGRAALQTENGGLAARHFQSYLKTDETDAEAWLDLARAQFLCGNADLALGSVEQSLARNAASPAAQVLRGHCYFQMGQDEAAAAAYSESLALGADPVVIQPFLNLLVMQGGNSLQPQAASSAKETAVSPRD